MKLKCKLCKNKLTKNFENSDFNKNFSEYWEFYHCKLCTSSLLSKKDKKYASQYNLLIDKNDKGFVEQYFIIKNKIKYCIYFYYSCNNIPIFFNYGKKSSNIKYIESLPLQSLKLPNLDIIINYPIDKIISILDNCLVFG